MCAINPAHQAEFTFKVFTSDKHVSADDFMQECMDAVLKTEIVLNSITNKRWHLQPLRLAAKPKDEPAGNTSNIIDDSKPHPDWRPE